jgi:hypothetical protein
MSLTIFFKLLFVLVLTYFFVLCSYEGPWFRMSGISYPEILDTRKAVKELAGNLT